MKTVACIIFIVLFSWLQVVFPAQIAPWHLVPALSLLVTFSFAVHYGQTEQVLWYGLAAGLAVDLYTPSIFGTWSLACMLVVLVTSAVHTRLLPRANWMSILATAAVALGVGELVIVVREFITAGIGAFSFSLVRVYLPRVILDLIIVLPISALVRSVLRALRVTSESKITLPNVSGR